MLAQEPWCYTPEQIGRLTDWQIEHLYVRPAIERSERIAPTAPAPGQPLGARREPQAEGPPGEPGSPQHRSACIGAYMSVQGLNRERAEAQYAAQLAEHEAGKV